MATRNHAVVLALGSLLFWSRASLAADCDNPGADWVFCEDFEGSDAQSGNLGKWEDQGLTPSNLVVTTDPTRVHGGARALEITSHKGVDTGGGPTKWFLPGVDTVYVRYWLQFSANYNYPHHMVFIGASEASNQWAAFGMAGCRPSGSNFFAVSVDLFSQGNHPPPGAFGLYSYSVDMQCDPGANCANYADPDAICNECAGKGSPCNNGPECCWGANNLSSPAAVSALEQWVCVEAKISANTGGQANGSQTLWIDDQQVGDWSGTVFRTDDALKINSLGLWHYVTDDSYAPGQTEQTVWFDDVAISTSRIGCGDVVPSTGGGGGTSTGGSPSGGSGPGGTSAGGTSSGGASNGGSAATPESEDQAGCGCRTPARTPSSGAPFFALVALAVALLGRRKHLARLCAALLFLGTWLTASTASAQPACTDGVDCHCDTAVASGALVCEDWEDARWHAVTDSDGSWIDDNGNGVHRGGGSLWTELYGPANSGCAWNDGEPENPILGVTCDLTSGGQACFAAALMPNDEFQAPVTPSIGSLPTPPAGATAPNYACMKPVALPEHIDSENLGIVEPSALPFGRTMAFRVPQGNGASTWPTGNQIDRAAAGIVGAAQWPAVTEIGVTMAVAYSDNSGTSGIWNAPWKHDEYGSGGQAIEFWILGNTGTGGDDQLPFRPFRFSVSGGCSLAGANVIAGNFACDNSASLQYSPDPADYTQSVDWPWGTWGCVRAYQRGMGTADMELWIKFQGPNDSAERTLMHVTGFDGTTLTNQNYDGFVWNDYANVNQAEGQTTIAPTYRFQDNVTIVGNREPLTCAEIGFGAPSGGSGGTGGSGVGGGAGVGGSPTTGGASSGGTTSGGGGGASATPSSEDDGGCGCRTPRRAPGGGVLLWMFIAVAVLRRRSAR